MGIFGLFRGPQPAVGASDDSSSVSTSSSPSSVAGHIIGRKRRASSPASGRSVSAVAKRRKELDPTVFNSTGEEFKKSDSDVETAPWTSNFNRLQLSRDTSEDTERASTSQGGMDVDTPPDNCDLTSEGSLFQDDGISDSDDDEDSTAGGRGRRRYRIPPTPHKPKLDTLSASFQGGSLGAAVTSNMNLIPFADREYQFEEDTTDEDEDEDDDDEDGEDGTEEDTEAEDKESVVEDWTDLFEPEPSKNNKQPDEITKDINAVSAWPVDEDELMAYENGMASVRSFRNWTRDEKLMHRLLSLRGFHSLMPNTWSRDFLGVPLYPSLFAPADEPDKPVAIFNMSNQFRATKALRSLFDLQSRVTGLRQTGNAARIGAIIQKELRRYIAWAQHDACLDRCTPLVEMPNIVVKQFDVLSKKRKDQTRGRGRGLIRRMQDYFRRRAAEYRSYYASLPPFVETDDGQTQRRLRPPRLLYGFVVVQHAVMLLAIDAARPRAKPKCFANFNMSLGDQWLDASLNVAIPVHLARAAQMRCVEGLALPILSKGDSDDDA